MHPFDQSLQRLKRARTPRFQAFIDQPVAQRILADCGRREVCAARVILDCLDEFGVRHAA